ncbi:MAG TPA: sigma-70 family RNA polymerase sigma factor [Solirubrobacteraceae bacterium]|jgi:RNA polymerase sigma-70 factor, ECF subfamily|nr:sigma-70 family RNA polymerase sigma factor [Solirubrobacteraceae bacterium]
MEPLPQVELRDPDTFTAAYRRLWPTAHAAAVSVLRDVDAAQDIVQDVFASLWSHPEAYRPDRGSLTTFVRIMARSRALDRVRSHTAGTAAQVRKAREALVRPDFAEPPSETVIRRHRSRAMLTALDGLPDGQRAAVLLHHVGGLSDRELAQATCVPLGTAKSRIRLGTARARDAVEHCIAA